ncbi:hypothetical protein [Streptomyces parvus]|uniref:hypothetical protein n=1 Tax=Streptomyces parvus TaxID=66428 RepID=UPI0037F11E77
MTSAASAHPHRNGRRVADAALTGLAAGLSSLVSGLSAPEREGLDLVLRSLPRAARNLPDEHGA